MTPSTCRVLKKSLHGTDKRAPGQRGDQTGPEWPGFYPRTGWELPGRADPEGAAARVASWLHSYTGLVAGWLWKRNVGCTPTMGADAYFV